MVVTRKVMKLFSEFPLRFMLVLVMQGWLMGTSNAEFVEQQVPTASALGNGAGSSARSNSETRSQRRRIRGGLGSGEVDESISSTWGKNNAVTSSKPAIPTPSLSRATPALAAEVEYHSHETTSDFVAENSSGPASVAPSLSQDLRENVSSMTSSVEVLANQDEGYYENDEENLLLPMNLNVTEVDGSEISYEPILQGPNQQPQLNALKSPLFTLSCELDDATASTDAFVSSDHGKDDATWGSSVEKPYQTISFAVEQRKPCQTIYVLGPAAGATTPYRNKDFGKRSDEKKLPVVNLNGVSDLKIKSYTAADRPVIEFDGPGAFVGGTKELPATNIEISGFEIVGPGRNISFDEAMSKRLSQREGEREFYHGRGIDIQYGYYLNIDDMVIHDCPASAIHLSNADYVVVANSELFSNTYWSSMAESSVVLESLRSKNENMSDEPKIIVTRNLIHDNVNKVPYYNPNLAWDYSPFTKDCLDFDSCHKGQIEDCPWECRYGKKSQDFVMDGHGILVTSNADTYRHGRIEISRNTLYKNGMTAIFVDKSDKLSIVDNVIFDNGVVPRLDEVLAADRQPETAFRSGPRYSGIVLRESSKVDLRGNHVAARYEDDYSFQDITSESDDSSHFLSGSSNISCKGRIQSSLLKMVVPVTDLSFCESLEVVAQVKTG